MIQESSFTGATGKARRVYPVFGDLLKKANYAVAMASKFFTSVEDPSRVILMIEWDSVEAHTSIAARGAQRHARGDVEVSGR